jgi:N-acetylneuraminic acid mutarotase
MALVALLALALVSCTKRKPEEVDYAPDSPFNPYPPDSATNIDHTTLDVTLRWTATDPNSGDLLTYDVYLDTLNPPLVKIASGLTSPSYFLTGLSYNTAYCWKVFAKDNQGVITAGPVWSFTTLPHSNQAPYAPVYLAPTNSAAGEYPTLYFKWTCTDPNGDDTLYYNFYLGNTAALPAADQPYFQQNYLEKTGLAYDTKYYWRVIVRDNHWAFTEGPVYSFTTRTSPWVFKNSLPYGRFGFGTASINDKIYVVGGTNGLGPIDQVVEYDPQTDNWTVKRSIPFPRTDFATAVWNDNIYILGGYNYGNLYNKVDVYDPAGDTWDSLASMPEKLDLLTAQAVNGKIYALASYFVLEYDIASGRWWDTIMVHSYTDSATGEVYYDSSYSYIKTILPEYRSRFYYSTAVGNNNIYLLGGTSGPEYYPVVDVYSPLSNTWTSAGNMMAPASGLAVDTINGNIYVLGGYDGMVQKRVRKYNPLTNVWEIRSDMLTPRGYLGAAILNNRIYAIGGANVFPLATVEEYQLDLDPKR